MLSLINHVRPSVYICPSSETSVNMCIPLWPWRQPCVRYTSDRRGVSLKHPLSPANSSLCTLFSDSLSFAQTHSPALMSSQRNEGIVWIGFCFLTFLLTRTRRAMTSPGLNSCHEINKHAMSDWFRPYLISRNRSDVPEQVSVSTWDKTTINLNYFELQLNKMSDIFCSFREQCMMGNGHVWVAHMAVHFVQLTVVA